MISYSLQKGLHRYHLCGLFDFMPIHRPPDTTIYALINPINCTVFYIGATTHPLKKRMYQHMGEAYRFRDGKNGFKNDKKCKVILDILAKGLKPLIQEVEVCQGYLAPMHAEKFWIYQYKKVFKHPITNTKDDLTWGRARKKAYAKDRVYW